MVANAPVLTKMEVCTDGKMMTLEILRKLSLEYGD